MTGVNMDIWGDVVGNTHVHGTSAEGQTMSANQLLQNNQAIETSLAALNL